MNAFDRALAEKVDRLDRERRKRLLADLRRNRTTVEDALVRAQKRRY